MELNIPAIVRIGGHDYYCGLEENLARDKECNGASCGNALRIVIDRSLPQQNRESVFIHEVLEQINYRFELNLPHEKITILETALYAFLQDNPEVFGFVGKASQ